MVAATGDTLLTDTPMGYTVAAMSQPHNTSRTDHTDTATPDAHGHEVWS